MRQSSDMKVVEVFTSLQGEGPFAGRPATFVRFAGCNLRCKWCDTKFAYEEAELLNESEVWMSLGPAFTRPNHRIIFTGGEPLLQQQALKRILSQIPALYAVGIETNATIVPDAEMLYRDYTTVVASPKPEHLVPEALQVLALHGAYFKFVVGSGAWSAKDALEVCKKFGVQRDDIWLMPQGATRAEQLSLMSEVWDTCVREGVNFGARLHTLTFDQKRGV